MNWTFWQNIVSPHLSPIARALASIPDQSVTVVAENEMSEGRRAIGWHVPDCSPARVVIGPTDEDVKRLIGPEGGQLSVHLLCGLSGVALNRRVLPHLARAEAISGLISEGADNRGLLGLARRVKYYRDRYHVGNHLKFILAIGQLGVR
jgi:hypothetical protein